MQLNFENMAFQFCLYASVSNGSAGFAGVSVCFSHLSSSVTFSSFICVEVGCWSDIFCMGLDDDNTGFSETLDFFFLSFIS